MSLGVTSKSGRKGSMFKARLHRGFDQAHLVNGFGHGRELELNDL